MALTRQEVNLRRLLAKCELLMKSGQKEDAKFLKYVSSLDEMLAEIKGKSSPASNENITNYLKRVRNLKFQSGLMSTEELAPCDSDDKDSNKSSPRVQLFVRKRNATKAEGEDDLEQIINYHQGMHEKIAEEMLSLTRNLKEQTSLANKIIKKDTEVVGRSAELTDQNSSQLKIESKKLTEHSKKAWKCWMWIMLLIVMAVFINMVVFMKVVKKKY